jgi:hypothetical protein
MVGNIDAMWSGLEVLDKTCLLTGILLIVLSVCLLLSGFYYKDPDGFKATDTTYHDGPFEFPDVAVKEKKYDEI